MAAADGRRPRGLGRLRSISLWAALSLEERDTLEALSQPVTLDHRETLFSPRRTCRFGVQRHQRFPRLYRHLPDGRRQVTAFAIPGDFLGLSLLDNFTVSADALNPVTACRFERKAFMALAEDHPSLLMHLHAITGHDLSLAEQMMMLLGRRTADERIAAFLVSLRLRYERTGQTSVTLELPMGRLDIADHLGLTIETVSRTLTRVRPGRGHPHCAGRGALPRLKCSRRLGRCLI